MPSSKVPEKEMKDVEPAARRGSASSTIILCSPSPEPEDEADMEAKTSTLTPWEVQRAANLARNLDILNGIASATPLTRQLMKGAYEAGCRRAKEAPEPSTRELRSAAVPNTTASSASVAEAAEEEATIIVDDSPKKQESNAPSGKTDNGFLIDLKERLTTIKDHRDDPDKVKFTWTQHHIIGGIYLRLAALHIMQTRKEADKEKASRARSALKGKGKDPLDSADSNSPKDAPTTGKQSVVNSLDTNDEGEDECGEEDLPDTRELLNMLLQLYEDGGLITEPPVNKSKSSEPKAKKGKIPEPQAKKGKISEPQAKKRKTS